MPLYPRTENYGLANRLDQALAQPADYRPLPGFRHPCRNDGFSGLPGLVYNDERRNDQKYSQAIKPLNSLAPCHCSVFIFKI